CVVFAAPVLAFTSRRTHLVAVMAAPHKPVSSTATCPTGQHVLFGGFKVAEQQATGFVTGLRRTANDAWTVDAYNLGAINTYTGFASSPIGVSSFVYCGLGAVPSKATSTVEIRYRSGRPSGSATARCPAGTVVVAGGFASTPGSTLFVTDLERVASDLWRVSGYLSLLSVYDGHTVVALTSIAYCGPGPAPKLVSRTLDTYSRGGTARATCPVGTQLAFGGAIVPTGSDADFTYLKTLRAETRSTWSVGGGGGNVTALAYCR
ncbi:MAG: hypothetical protein ACLPVY_09705, partial [Acidimicrobiia bacterium]